jgi:hypothetical protein
MKQKKKHFLTHVSFEWPLTRLSCHLNAEFHVLRGPMPKDAGTPLLLLQQIFNPFYNLNCSAWECAPDAGLQKRDTFSTLIVGRWSGVAGSGASRSATHYDLGVDYTCVLDVQFRCAFHRRMRFQCQFWVFNTENDIENACDDETHIQTAHPKRKCNRLLTIESA